MMSEIYKKILKEMIVSGFCGQLNHLLMENEIEGVEYSFTEIDEWLDMRWLNE